MAYFNYVCSVFLLKYNTYKPRVLARTVIPRCYHYYTYGIVTVRSVSTIEYIILYRNTYYYYIPADTPIRYNIFIVTTIQIIIAL